MFAEFMCEITFNIYYEYNSGDKHRATTILESHSSNLTLPWYEFRILHLVVQGPVWYYIGIFTFVFNYESKFWRAYATHKFLTRYLPFFLFFLSKSSWRINGNSFLSHKKYYVCIVRNSFVLSYRNIQ